MLFGCGGTDLKIYDGTEPKISFRKLYDSNVEGYGYFKNRSGEIEARYYVTLEPKWDGSIGAMKEFNYQDTGKITNRDWKITMIDDDHFTATGNDIQGVLKGETHGAVMHMNYTFLVTRESGSKIAIDMDDWTYLQPDGMAINQVYMSKFGFRVGELVYTLKKLHKGEKFKSGYLVK